MWLVLYFYWTEMVQDNTWQTSSCTNTLKIFMRAHEKVCVPQTYFLDFRKLQVAVARIKHYLRFFLMVPFGQLPLGMSTKLKHEAKQNISEV